MRRGNCKVIHGFLLVPSVLVAQSWQLCNPMDCSLNTNVCVRSVTLTMSDSLWPLWTIARQAPLSMGFSRQEYWSGLPFSSPGDLPNPATEPDSPSLQADSLPFEPPIQEPAVTIFKIDKRNWSFRLFAQMLLAFWSSGLQNWKILALLDTYYDCALLKVITEKAMAPHSSTLAWKIPWMEEPGRLQSMGSPRVRHDWATSLSLFAFTQWRRKWHPTPVFLPGDPRDGVAQSRTQLKWISSK